MVDLNLVAVAWTFGCFGLSPFSQRARTTLACTVGPGLLGYLVWKGIQGIDLLSELTFYSAYHMEPRNVVIHAIFVPLIVFASMVWMAYVPLPLPGALSTKLSFNAAHALAIGFGIFHVSLDVGLGALAAALWWAMAAYATRLVRAERSAVDKAASASGKPIAGAWRLGTSALIAGGLKALGWYMQCVRTASNRRGAIASAARCATCRER